jgi:GDPmannose 4,6-dehydratase
LSIKRALISGVTGQDGSYLAESLTRGSEVHGIGRRVALEDRAHRMVRIVHLADRIHLHAASLENMPGLYRIFLLVRPDECYHLAAQSFVSYSFDDEFSTMNVNVNGTHHMLVALKDARPGCRFYFAGTSEMFVRTEEAPQSEKTCFLPRSAYGISKLALDTTLDLTDAASRADVVKAMDGTSLARACLPVDFISSNLRRDL